MSERSIWDRPRAAVLIITFIWAATVGLQFVRLDHPLGALAMDDPDDSMRLMQVRDWIAGQSWFDVTQYRSNPPMGAPMHWTRLVDIPIAALILLFRPLLGNHMAEVVALSIVPMITLGAVMFGLYLVSARVMGRASAALAVALLATSFSILNQAMPQRIDHHAWQIAMAGFALGGLIAANPRTGGVISGIAMAVSLQISSEGLPLAAILGGVLGLRYLERAEEWPRIWGYVASLAFASGAMLLATHGWSGALEPHCDAMSPVYVGPLLLLVSLVFVGDQLIGRATMTRRILVIGIAGAAAAALFFSTAGACLKGPFEMLDPIVYRNWYLNVMEGRPIWVQDRITQLFIIGPSLLGLAGYVGAVLSAEDVASRRNWLTLLLACLGTVLVSLWVLRAMSVAHLFAIPGNAWLIARLYRPVPQWKTPALRVIFPVMLAALTPGGAALAAATFGEENMAGQGKVDASTIRPLLALQVEKLDALPASLILTQLDFGPIVLVHSHHSVMSTGHHRNAAAMRTVLLAFTLKPDDARKVILRTSARYVMIVPALNEVGKYRQINRNGLGSLLLSGRHPDWLRPVSVTGAPNLRLYEIIRR